MNTTKIGEHFSIILFISIEYKSLYFGETHVMAGIERLHSILCVSMLTNNNEIIIVYYIHLGQFFFMLLGTDTVH